MTRSTRLEITGGLAEIILAQADRGNPFDLQFNGELCELANKTSADPAVRAILIRAEGKYFSVGADLKWLGQDRGIMPKMLKDATATLHMAIARFARGDAPVVTAVQGLCTGGATALIAMSDFVIAGQSAKFYAAYNRIGYVSDGGGSYFIPRRVGSRRAAEFLMLNQTWDADTAARNGLITRVVPDADLLTEARGLAEELAKGPTATFGEMKRLLLSCTDQPMETQLEMEAQAIVRCGRTDDCWNAIQGVLAKSPISYSGR